MFEELDSNYQLDNSQVGNNLSDEEAIESAEEREEDEDLNMHFEDRSEFLERSNVSEKEYIQRFKARFSSTSPTVTLGKHLRDEEDSFQTIFVDFSKDSKNKKKR